MLPAFNDGKEPGALRTIGEVSRALDIRQHVLRYWEEQFPMLRPIKRSGGRRYYRPEDVMLIVQINRLVHQDGYTLRGAKAALGAPAAKSPRAARSIKVAAPVPVPVVGGAGDALRAIRNDLEQALSQA